MYEVHSAISVGHAPYRNFPFLFSTLLYSPLFPSPLLPSVPLPLCFPLPVAGLPLLCVMLHTALARV